MRASSASSTDHVFRTVANADMTISVVIGKNLEPYKMVRVAAVPSKAAAVFQPKSDDHSVIDGRRKAGDERTRSDGQDAGNERLHLGSAPNPVVEAFRHEIHRRDESCEVI